MNQNRNIKAIDFYCSGGGMTCGLQKAGVNVIAGIDIDLSCKETYEKNNPNSKFIHADVFELSENELQSKLNLKKNDDNLLLIGCNPCQYWSIIQTDKTKSEESKDLLLEFHRFVEYLNPGYVVVENVPGLASRKEESGLSEFEADLEERGYIIESHVINLNEYGVPQTRKRFSLVATRIGSKPIFPRANLRKRPVVSEFIGVSNGFPKIKAGHKDYSKFNNTVAGLSEINLMRIKKTSKNGGSWLTWKDDPTLARKKYQGNEFMDNYGRMSWDKPAPTITTKFFSFSNGRFGHPEEDRAISLREGATLQTFPKRYTFYTNSIAETGKMIGNAVPPEYAKRIGRAIIESMEYNQH